MERLQLLEMSSIENPRFAAIQKCSKVDGLINLDLCSGADTPLGMGGDASPPHQPQPYPKNCAGHLHFADHQFIAVENKKVSENRDK